MSNKEIYKKTLTFSIHRFLYDIFAFLLLGVLVTGGFMLVDRFNDKGLIGLVIGLVIGIVALVLILRYVSYTYKAGQIAMMTKAVTEGELPEDVLGAGKAVVKKRFTTVAVYFAITRVISGIFNQLSKGLNTVGRAVGGDNGGNIADAISTVIQVIVAYLCDCCLGWVFYREEEKPAKATCEGAVLFFKHGKTFFKNMGRVFGMGLLSLLVIGGAFFGIFLAIFAQFPATFSVLAKEITEAGVRNSLDIPDFLTDPDKLLFAAAIAVAVILWSILHSVFVRPFVLVGVLRNYLESGMNDIPSEASFAMLDSKSSKFRKLRTEGI